MKDNVLHSDPSKYHTYNNCTAEEEIAAGSTEALYRKLEFIDNRIAELETLKGSQRKEWVSLQHLTAWFMLIEDELHFRKAISSSGYGGSHFGI